MFFVAIALFVPGLIYAIRMSRHLHKPSVFFLLLAGYTTLITIPLVGIAYTKFYFTHKGRADSVRLANLEQVVSNLSYQIAHTIPTPIKETVDLLVSREIELDHVMNYNVRKLYEAHNASLDELYSILDAMRNNTSTNREGKE